MRRVKRRDHPRVCGKDGIRKVTNSLCMGSPPRMRERQVNNIFIVPRDRITPAYAGKTPTQSNISQVMGDHPRVCGKDSAIALSFDLPAGSPPRMRERHACGYPDKTAHRITPAYAGKTLKDPNKMTISITETVKSHLLFRFNLSQSVVQQYFIFMK